MARERYLLDDTEETIHQNQIVPTTGKEKRANWWFYHRTAVIVTVIAVVVLVPIVLSSVLREKPDYQVGLLTGYSVPEELTEDIETMLAAYGEDLNGDGKVLVDVQALNFPINATDQYGAMELQASFVRFASDASEGDTMLFFYDDTAYTYLNGNDLSGFFGPAGSMTEDSVLWADVPGLCTLTLDKYAGDLESVMDLLGKLHVSLRTENGTAFEKEEVRQRRADSIALLDNLLHGTPAAVPAQS